MNQTTQTGHNALILTSPTSQWGLSPAYLGALCNF